jgi:hypothetical protein
MGIIKPQDIVDLFYEMVDSISKTIEIANKTNNLNLNVVFELEKEKFFYDNKQLSFSKYISALKEDTHYVKGYWSNTPSKIKTVNELQPQLNMTLLTIQRIIPRISKASYNTLDFIKKNKQFDISTSPLINILNILINFERESNMFDTLTMIDAIWPDLRKKIITTNINVKTYFNNVPTRRNNPKRNNPKPNNPKPNNPKPNNPKPNNPKPNNFKRNTNTKGFYPFGATSTRKRYRY